MNEISYADIVASLALTISLVSLSWNILRHFLQEKASIDFSITFGEIGKIKGTTTGLFADAGSLHPTHKFDSPGILIKIINTGRKQVCISNVGGRLKSGYEISMPTEGLPKMLQPYEIFSTTLRNVSSLLNTIQEKQLEEMWVKDTKGKKWYMTRTGRKKLMDTAEYILSKKHE